MGKYRDLKEYINENWNQQIFNQASCFIKKNISNDDISTDRIPYPNQRWLDDVAVTSVYTKHKEPKIEFYVSVRARLAFKGYGYGSRRNDIEEGERDIYLRMVIDAKFDHGLTGVWIKHISPLDEREQFNLKDSSTAAFIPYMSEENLDYYASQFLAEVCPEALNKAMALPLAQIAEKLGLQLVPENLPEGVFGKTYFLDNNADGHKKGTIVYDPEVGFIKGVGSINNTIAHEFVHWYFHKKYFELMRLFDETLTTLTCSTVEADIIFSNKNTEDYKWMEWQANALAPRILMPADATLALFNEIHPHNIHNCQNDEIAALERTIEQIATFFEVSKISARIRLIQLGVKKVAGINAYTNGQRSINHLTKFYQLDYNETFFIDFRDVVKLNLVNERLRASLQSKQILFVDGFFVINSDKYVDKGQAGEKKLTKYARENMDECCLVFTVRRKYQRKFDDRFYSMCFMSRTDNEEFIEANIDERNQVNNLVFARAGSLAQAVEDAKEIEEFLNAHRSDKFCDFFEALIGWAEFPNNNSEIGRATGLDSGTISNYRNGTSKPFNVKNVLAICAGLHLEPRLSYALLNLCGYSIGGRHQDVDHAYIFLIENAYEEGLDFWNHHLKNIKIEGATLP